MHNLKEYAEQNPDLVMVRQSVRYPELRVVKYHRRVFYKGLWTPELCEMRGLVVDQDWNPVVVPFTKVFNRGERNTDIDRDEEVVAVRKINGFMAAATKTADHGLIISTTGSLDSDFADMAAEHIDQSWDFQEGVTYLFEIVDDRDPHIIAEREGAWLIGARDTRTGEMKSEGELDSIAVMFDGVLRPEWFMTQFGDLVKQVRECRHEGYMVQGSVNLKIKSPYYLTKKLFARIRADKLQDQNFWTNNPRLALEEEYYPLADYIRENVDEFVALDEQNRLRFMETFLSEVA